MKLVLKVGDCEYVLSAAQMERIVSVLAESEAVAREYLGASAPESERFLSMVVPYGHPMVPILKADLMDDTKYAALTATYKMREAEKRK